jgi:hypothetical protein
MALSVSALVSIVTNQNKGAISPLLGNGDLTIHQQQIQIK